MRHSSRPNVADANTQRLRKSLAPLVLSSKRISALKKTGTANQRKLQLCAANEGEGKMESYELTHNLHNLFCRVAKQLILPVSDNCSSLGAESSGCSPEGFYALAAKGPSRFKSTQSTFHIFPYHSIIRALKLSTMHLNTSSKMSF